MITVSPTWQSGYKAWIPNFRAIYFGEESEMCKQGHKQIEGKTHSIVK